MAVLTTEIRNGRLVLSVEEGNSLRNVEIPIYRITTPDLAGVSIAGSGNVVVDGVDTTEFTVDIAGSGYVQPSGSADHISVSISGSGDYDGASLSAPTAEVSIAGSGAVVVNATDALDVSIAGSGDVVYLGNPTLTQSIDGDGRVSQR